VRLYGSWKVALPGETYVWEPDDTTVGEELLIESELGDEFVNFDQWVLDIDARKANPCQVLIWLLRRKAGRQEERFAVQFPIRRLDITEIAEPEPLPPSLAGSETSEPATESPSPATESAPGSGTS
jgi:hypothetical protein